MSITDYPPPEDGPEEEDLWFLPGPVEEEEEGFSPLHPPLPRAEATEGGQLADWATAEAGQAARLARVAGRLGALDDRLLRGPAGWRQRLALTEAADLSWITGGRITADRLGLWVAMRVSALDEDGAALQRAAWVFRRLSGGPGPEAGLASFLGRHETGGDLLLPERFAGWEMLIAEAAPLHPLTRAAMGFHLWPLAGIGREGDLLEGAVIAARQAVAEGQGGALFAPLAMGGPVPLRLGGPPEARLVRWLDGLDQALLTAARLLDRVEAWQDRAREETARLSGRTPGLLIAALRDWPFLSAPMAETLTGASRAAVQRNLTWMEKHALVDEVTGQGRYRFWRAATGS
ncbi:MAG: hypothetical protein ACK5M4_12390 [Pseudorhodobacter sp.]